MQNVLNSTKQQLKFVLILFVIVTLVEVVNLFTGRWLNHFGLLPRNLDALPGIALSPLLHGSFSHFASNIVPLVIFSFLMLQYGIKRFGLVTLWIIVSSGLLVWLFGRTAMHVGASGLIYGYFGFLVLAGFLSGRVKLIAIALIVAFFYGGLIFGVMPTRPFVSWESHLFGFATGLLAAKIWTPRSAKSSQ